MAPHIDASSLSSLLRDPDYAARALNYAESVFEYAGCVIAFSSRTEAARALHGSDDAAAYREEVEKIDHDRTAKHNSAIASLSTLNKMADRVQCPPVYVGDIQNDDRKVVAHAIFEFAAARLREEDATV